MNTTNNKTLCDPDNPAVPAALLWFGLLHCYCVFVIGTLGNALALWCVGTCGKTRRPVKVLLFSVFLPALLVCLVTRPVIGETVLSMLTCNPDRISGMAVDVNSAVYSSLATTELASIAAVAVVRAVSVLFPHVRSLEIRGASLLVAAICVYSGVSGVGLVVMMVKGDSYIVFVTILFFINTTLPAIITAVAYILMMVAVQRNKRRLAANQQQASRSVSSMDQATWAMLAVFLSNLVFGVPHTIYHLLGKQPLYMSVIFHLLFFMHFMVDPLVFMWFNNNYRARARSYVQKVKHSLSFPSTSSTVQHSTTSQNDNNHHQHSEKNRQADTNV